jgi:hypothetical protein
LKTKTAACLPDKLSTKKLSGEINFAGEFLFVKKRRLFCRFDHGAEFGAPFISLFEEGFTVFRGLFPGVFPGTIPVGRVPHGKLKAGHIVFV